MIIVCRDGKFIIKDSFSGLEYGEYESYDKAAETLREIKKDMAASD